MEDTTAGFAEHTVSSNLDMGSGLDCGVFGTSVDVTPPKGYSARPVTNDVGALVAVIFGSDQDLSGDIEKLAEALLRYQKDGVATADFEEARLKRLTLHWIDVPAVVPVVNGRSLPEDNRMKSSFYAGLPNLGGVTGLFFSSSANINYMLDKGMALDSYEAKKFGLYVPFATCPKGA